MWSSTRWRADPSLGGVAALSLCLALAAPVLANTGDNRASPSVQAVPGTGSHPLLPGSRLQGQALLRFFGLQVYQAHLWTRADFRPEQLEQQPLVLELQYLRDFKGSAIAERSLQEMRRSGSVSEERGQRWLSEMQRIFPDVKSGDRIAGVHQPGQGAAFWHNGRPAGRIDDTEFARRFFGIWLAPSTSEPDMRTALLGLQSQGQR